MTGTETGACVTGTGAGACVTGAETGACVTGTETGACVTGTFIPSRALLDDEELLDDNHENFDLREPRDEFDLISSFNSRRSKR